jgi:hypothetical protein
MWEAFESGSRDLRRTVNKRPCVHESVCTIPLRWIFEGLMMKRRICIAALALGLLATVLPQRAVEAQTLTIGRGGVSYNGYGHGYYGGYGRGYNGYTTHYGNGYNNGGAYRGGYGYSGYGNGPYGYGSGRTYVNPAYGGYGYGNSGYYRQGFGPVYRPIGYGVYSTYGW